MRTCRVQWSAAASRASSAREKPSDQPTSAEAFLTNRAGSTRKSGAHVPGERWVRVPRTRRGGRPQESLREVRHGPAPACCMPRVSPSPHPRTRSPGPNRGLASALPVAARALQPRDPRPCSFSRSNTLGLRRRWVRRSDDKRQSGLLPEPLLTHNLPKFSSALSMLANQGPTHTVPPPQPPWLGASGNVGYPASLLDSFPALRVFFVSSFTSSSTPLEGDSSPAYASSRLREVSRSPNSPTLRREEEEGG
jgi:hypothetical protein